MAAAVASLVAPVVANVVGQVAGNVMGSLMQNFGGNNVAGALSNLFMGSLGEALKGVIDQAPLPGFMKEAAKGVIDDVIGNNQQATSPECQDAVNDCCGEMMQNISSGIADQASEEAKEGGKGQNWLVALAGALGKVQLSFLEQAMENMDKMESNKAQEGDSKEEAAAKRDEFVMAQSEYQANMQMFNMTANMTATTLKSVGEGLTAIARKQ